MLPAPTKIPSTPTIQTNTCRARQNAGAAISVKSTSTAADADVLLTEHEVAERQARSVRTLQSQRIRGGGIPYLKLGRSVRYRLSDVAAWEEARRCTSTSQGGGGDA